MVRPDLTAVYRCKVANLTKALGEPETATEAAELLRGLIDEVRMVPVEGRLEAHLYGALGRLLALGNENTRSSGPGVQVTLVAGASNQRFLHFDYARLPLVALPKIPRRRKEGKSP